MNDSEHIWIMGNGPKITGANLESVCGGNFTVGSNPTATALSSKQEAPPGSSGGASCVPVAEADHGSQSGCRSPGRGHPDQVVADVLGDPAASGRPTRLPPLGCSSTCRHRAGAGDG